MTRRFSRAWIHSMNNIQAYVFDLDDTLILEEDYLKSGFLHVDKFLRENHSITGFYEKSMALHDSGFKGYVINETLKQLRVSNEEEMLIIAYHEYRNHFPQIELQEDARQLLSHLRARRIPTGVISDGPLNSQLNKVRAADIERWVDKVILTDRYGRDFWKPHPRAYMEMEEYFAKAPQSFVYIADNPLKDFITPKQRGWFTVQIRRKGGLYGTSEIPPDHQAHRTITSLLQLRPESLI